MTTADLTLLTDIATSTALADHEPTTGYLSYEIHPDGGVFIPAQVAHDVPHSLFESLALSIHRAALEATTAEENDYYEQYTLAADKVPGNTCYTLNHHRDTNTVSAIYTVHQNMYLTGSAVGEYLKTVHQMLDHMGQLVDPNRPVNAAAHLLAAADRIEEYTAETESENWADVAAHLFAQYMVIFSAREYESDYTPVENLADALVSEGDYAALEDAGLICSMFDTGTESLSSWHLPLFAGE